MTSYSYASPVLLAENLWELRGAWSNPFGRRMTVIRLANGDVYVHNAIQLEPRDLAWLRGLGPVRGIIAPNKFHSTDAPWMAKEFPEASLFAPAGKRAEFAAQGLTPLDVALDFPVGLGGELECVPMLGSRVEEAAFVHHPSRTLILCDLAMNMEDVFTGFQRAFMHWNNVGGRFGVTKLTRWVFTSDKKALVASYDRLFERDFDRVIVNHGAVLETGGKDLLRASVHQIFGIPRSAPQAASSATLA